MRYAASSDSRTGTLGMNPVVRQSMSSPWVWLLFLSLQIPSMRTLDKYVEGPLFFAVPLLLVVAFLCYGALIDPPAALRARLRVLDRGWPASVLWVVYTVAAMVVYPIADGLKREGRGSDQDDAIMIAAANVLNGLNPYDTNTYFGNPISPGPGWILLWVPLVAIGAYWLITPLSLALAAWSLRLAGHGWRASNLFMLFMGSSMIFWELMVVGSDLIAIGCLFLAAVAWLVRSKRTSTLMLLAVFVGALATSRIVFFYVPLVFGLMLWRRDRRLAVGFALVGSAVCFGLHGWFWHLGPDTYSPLHILTKGQHILPRYVQGLALLACLGSAVAMLRLRDANLRDGVLMLWLSLATPLVFVTFGDLVVFRGGDFAAWEGANYLMPPLALAAGLVAVEARARAG